MKNFPEIIPIFPLSGVIYFPKTNLPLNIFEERYLNLVNDSYKGNKLIGMVQSRKNKSSVYKIGCLGKISQYQKSEDGRILINLTGLTRFEIVNEVDNKKLYREFRVNYKNYFADSNIFSGQNDIQKLLNKAKIFLKRNGLILNWKEFDKLDESQKINTLAMIAPVTNEEKQKLLESVSAQDMIKNLDDIISFYLHSINFSNQTIQ